MAESGSDAPLQRLIDLMIYAPIGLLTVAKAELPQLIATGKTRLDSQLTVAKFIGKMAVNQGKLEVQRRLDAAEQARQQSAVTTTLETLDPSTDHTSGHPAVDLATASLPEAVIELVAHSPILGDPALNDGDGPLPIDGYDSLAASQVVGRLGSLTAAELDSVEAYETTHRARRTILGKINQLRAS
ncbi:MAG: hypothetical protein JWL72_1626 [Ilumatobacteraceae bacterium]|nr:hypothetical protein [Ilumatobacteraceae bacterium]